MKGLTPIASEEQLIEFGKANKNKRIYGMDSIASLPKTAPIFRSSPSDYEDCELQNAIGRISNIRINENGLYADVHLDSTRAADIIALLERGVAKVVPFGYGELVQSNDAYSVVNYELKGAFVTDDPA